MTLTAASRPVVLIVEDEFLLRMNAVEMIEEAGFEVVEAGNADEAIAILESRLDIRVVFTDIQMRVSRASVDVKSSTHIGAASNHSVPLQALPLLEA
jgi:CheY-like chemotaxis protein